MKITSVTARAVNIPFKTPYVWAVGGYLGITRVIVEVQTDEGITGYGEAPSWECQEDIMKHMAPKLIGKDPLDITACELVCVPEMKVLVATDGILPRMSFGGIEIALWDIRGKLWNMPLYKMLGGAACKEVPFCEYFSRLLPKGAFKGISTEDEIIEYCVKRKEEFGSTYFEGKISSGNVKQDIALIRRLRSALGDDAILRIDGNMAWSLPSAIELCRGIEEYNIRQFEDPMATFWEMEKLRKHTSIPFSTHNTDIALAARLGVPDTFVINSTTLGGINRTVGFIRACEHMGINISFYSGDTGLATAVYMHFYAALDHVREPSQSLFRFMEFDIIEGGPLNPRNNIVSVPEGPGIGVAINEERVRYGHELFKKDGSIDQYYNPKKPGQYIRLPLN
jgi:glucarate dehydratase